MSMTTVYVSPDQFMALWDTTDPLDRFMLDTDRVNLFDQQRGIVYIMSPANA